MYQAHNFTEGLFNHVLSIFSDDLILFGLKKGMPMLMKQNVNIDVSKDPPIKHIPSDFRISIIIHMPVGDP